MTETARTAPTARRAWVLTAVRAGVAALTAIAITFTSGHDIRFGLLAVGCFALATGLILAIAYGGRTRDWATGIHALVSLVAGALALTALGIAEPPAGLFVAIVAGWALLSGAAELVRGLRVRPRGVGERDQIGAGALTVLLAVALVVVPSDFHTVFNAPDGTQGVVTTAVVLVGAFGAYAALIAVYLGIGAVSLRGEKSDALVASERTNGE